MGDIIVSVNGKSLAGKTSDQSTALIKGPAGSPVTLGLKDGAQAHDEARQGRHPDRPVRDRSARDGKKIAWVRLAGFTSGSGEDVKKAVKEELKKGAKGVVLDLRHNGGGLLNEAVSVASVFLEDGRVVSTKGRARPERVYNAEGGAIKRSIPVVVLVDEGSASASEIVTGALQDRKRAKVVGTRTFGKGVFQEIERLPNGGALDITVGEYFTPTGATSAAAACAAAPASRPTSRPPTTRRPAKDEALRRGAGDGGRGVRSAPLVGVLDNRARVTPLFERGQWVNVDKPRGDVRAGDIVQVAPGKGGAGADRAADRAPGRRARRARGADARARAAAALRPAGRARGADRRVRDRARRSARDFRELTTFTIDPPTARGLRRRDLGRGARRRRGAGVGAHRRRLGVRAAGLGARPRGVPARELGLRARPGRADAARGAVEPRLLAGAGRGPADRDGGARVRGREGPAHRVPPLADPLRRAARLPARGPDLRGRGAGARIRGRSRWPPRARSPRRWPRRARRAARWPSSPASRSSASRATGTSRACCRPSRPSRTG